MAVIVVQLLCCFQLFTTPWTVAHQAPLSMGFSRQKYWSGLTFPSSGESSLTNDQIVSVALAGGFFTTESPGKTGISIKKNPTDDVQETSRFSNAFTCWDGGALQIHRNRSSWFDHSQPSPCAPHHLGVHLYSL